MVTLPRLLCIGFVACSQLVVHAGDLDIEWRTATTHWGGALRGYLVLRGVADPGLPLLGAWEQNFHLDLGYLEEVTADDGSSQLRQAFKLYPRSSGALQLPTVHWGGLASRASTVAIGEPRAEGVELSIESSLPRQPQTVRAGEAYPINIVLRTSDSRPRVLIDPATSGHALFAPWRMEQQTIEIDGQVQVEHRFSNLLAVQSVGALSLSLPPLRYRLFGRDLLKLYLPRLQLEVKALPAYIPPHIPVGRPRIESRIENRQWVVDVATASVLPLELPELRAALARLASVAPGQVESVLSDVGPQGVASTNYRLPLPELMLGGEAVITQRYFDLQTQRLQTLEHRLPGAWRLPAYALLILAALLLPALFFAARGLFRAWRHARLKRSLRRSILNCRSPQELRRLLSAETLFERNPVPGSKQAFPGGQADLDVLKQRLNGLCFAAQRDDEEWQSLQRECAASISVLRPSPG